MRIAREVLHALSVIGHDMVHLSIEPSKVFW